MVARSVMRDISMSVEHWAAQCSARGAFMGRFDLAKANRCYPHHDGISASLLLFLINLDRIAEGGIELKVSKRFNDLDCSSLVMRMRIYHPVF